MKSDFKILLFCFSGFLAVFILFGFVSAQEIDKQRALEIVQSQGGPGGCNSEESCRAFCDEPGNYEVCINWARDNGLVSSEEAERAGKVAKVGREFSGPGGCQSLEECRNFCDEPSNHEICLDFAVQQGFLSAEEAQRIKEFRSRAGKIREEFEARPEIDPEFNKERAMEILQTQGGPGGCETFEECAEFCDQPGNQQACFEFAEEHRLFRNKENVQKIRKIISEGGPGGCRGPKECELFCSEPSNQELCFEWARQNGFVSEEQIRMMEEFKRRREELETRHDEFIEDFQQGVPPGEFLGPGGCTGAEECRKYCEDPAHQEECEAFKTSGGLQPPGFGGTPPAGTRPTGQMPSLSPYQSPNPSIETPAYSPIPQPAANPATECTERDGHWDPEINTCIFKSPSILQQSGAYILETLKGFLR